MQSQQKLQQTNQRLEILRSIDAAGLTSNDLHHLAAAVFEKLPLLIPAARISIFLLDDETRTATMISETGPGADPLVPNKVFSLQVPDEMYEQMRHGQPFHIDDVSQYLHISPLFPALYAQGIRSFISAPLLVQGQHLGSLNIGSKQPGRYTAQHTAIAREVGDRLALSLQNTRLYQELENSLEKQRKLSARLVEIQEDEWKRIARDIHDQIGSQLTVLKMMLERLLAQGNGPAEDWQSIQELVDEMIHQAVELQQELRPTQLDNLGLLPTLIWYIERFDASSPMSVHFSHRDIDRRFEPQIEITTFRVIQEALTNVARHSEAHDVDVMVWYEDNALEIHISDDGKGMDLKQIEQSGHVGGLHNLQERVRTVGGELKIYTQPGEGVEIVATIPVPAVKEEQDASYQRVCR